jgi:hypothetical protein
MVGKYPGPGTENSPRGIVRDTRIANSPTQNRKQAITTVPFRSLEIRNTIPFSAVKISYVSLPVRISVLLLLS